MEAKEIWKDIKGYEGLYQISNLGRVKSYKYKKGRILKERKTKTNYARVHLRKNNKNKDYYIHRLVALHFICNPKKYKEVNHINENKLDNRVENLEWVTRSQNCRHNKLNERIGEKKAQNKYQYDFDYNLIFIHKNNITLKRNGFFPCAVRRCCKGIYKQYKGFIWSYEPINKKYL